MMEYKMDELVEIPGDEVSHAMRVWVYTFSETKAVEVLVREFYKLIGPYNFHDKFSYLLTPEAAARVRGICGPHGHAYCKALAAVREEVT